MCRVAVGNEASEGARAVLSAARSVWAGIPGWRRVVALAQAEMADPTADFARIERILSDPDAQVLRDEVEKISAAGEGTGAARTRWSASMRGCLFGRSLLRRVVGMKL